MEAFIKIGNLVESLKREKELHYKLGREERLGYEQGDRPNGWHYEATCNAYANGIDYTIHQIEFYFKEELEQYNEIDY